MSAEKPGILYGRISGEHDEREASLETQITSGLKKAKALGITIAPDDIHQERHSGKFLHSRKVFAEVREKVRSGRYSYLIVHAFDRCSRKMAHTAIIDEECETYGLKLVSCTEDSDSSPEGKLLKMIRAYLAEAEITKIRERTARGLDHKIASGKAPCAGHAKYGWRFNREQCTIEVDESTAPIVTRLFEMVANGDSCARVAQAFNEEGIPCWQALHGFRKMKGEPIWRLTTIAAMVRNPLYKGGPFHYNKQRKEYEASGAKRVILVPRSQWVEVPGVSFPRIVSDTLWSRANHAMSKACTRPKNVASDRPQRMLQGMVFCAGCGTKCSPYGIKANGKHYWYYRCNSVLDQRVKEQGRTCRAKMTRIDYAHEQVWARVSSALSNPSQIDRLVQAALARINRHGAADDLGALKKKAKELSKTLDVLQAKWTAALAKGEVRFSNAIEDQIHKTTVSLESIEREIATTQTEQATSGLTIEASRATVLKLAKQALRNDASPDTRRQLLLALGTRVVAEGKDLAIEINPLVKPTSAMNIRSEFYIRTRVAI